MKVLRFPNLTRALHFLCCSQSIGLIDTLVNSERGLSDNLNRIVVWSVANSHETWL